MHDIRVMRSVLINSASHPMSTQPSVGGPIYWIRNIVYHAPADRHEARRDRRACSSTTTRSLLRRTWGRRPTRTLLGQSTVPAIFSETTSTSHRSSDYNGFRPNPGVL
jgi:hypothetical protein